MARWGFPGSFETMGVPILSGRDISDTDGPETPFVVLLSQGAAETLFPNSDPVGRAVTIGDWRDCEVVGVVENLVGFRTMILSLAVRQLLYGVELLDAPTYLWAVLNLALFSVLASYLPARRASRGDVVDVLRTE